MYVGTQVGARNDADFEQWAQLGVVNVCSDPPGDARTWTKDDLARHREKLETYGITDREISGGDFPSSIWGRQVSPEYVASRGPDLVVPCATCRSMSWPLQLQSKHWHIPIGAWDHASPSIQQR